MYIYINIHIHKYMYAHTNTHIHIHTHMYTHSYTMIKNTSPEVSSIKYCLTMASPLKKPTRMKRDDATSQLPRTLALVCCVGLF